MDDNEPSSLERKLTNDVLDSLKTTVNFIHIKHPSNLNGSVARNTGFEQSRGDYISFLDSDDEYDSRRLSTCVSLMENAHYKYAGVYSGCVMKKGGKVSSTLVKAKSGNFLIDSLGCVFEFYSGSNLFVRRQVYNELGGFDELLWRHQDYDFLVRLFQRYDLIGVSRILLMKNNDNRNLPKATRLVDIKKYFLEKYSHLLDELSPYEAAQVLYCHNIAMSESFASEGNFKAAWKYYLMSIKHKVEIIRFIRVMAKFLKFHFSV